MTVIQFNLQRTKKEESLRAKIVAEIEALTEIQSRVNASMGERQRATKEQSLIAKILKNLVSQLKSAEKLETLKAIESDLRKQLDDIENTKKKAERAAGTGVDHQY